MLELVRSVQDPGWHTEAPRPLWLVLYRPDRLAGSLEPTAVAEARALRRGTCSGEGDQESWVGWSKTRVIAAPHLEEGQVIVPLPHPAHRNLLAFNSQRANASLMCHLL